MSRRVLVPKWRTSTWALLVWNVLVAVWLIGGIGSAADLCVGVIGAELQRCEGASSIGATVVLVYAFFIWFFVNALLVAIWAVSRRTRS